MIYAESSAVLSWLLGEPQADEVRHEMIQAASVCTSELTLVECDRALCRAEAAGDLSSQAAAELRRVLAQTAEPWDRLLVTSDVRRRAGQPFPLEPMRTLDALHLASALRFQAFCTELRLLSLDRRVRDNGIALGFTVVP